MRRREFIAGLGSAAAWPLVARAQQQQAMPVVGFLNSQSPDGYANLLRAYHQGLGESGYVEGRNVVIEYRWAEGRNDRLPAMAADLARRQVRVIAANTFAALASKAATMTIPIVFVTAGDPIGLGLVASLSRPGGNITGVTTLNSEVGPKRLQLLHELIPTTNSIALLVNPTNPSLAEPLSRDLQAAARALGLQLHVLQASTEQDFETVFATLHQLRIGALVIGDDGFFTSRRQQLAALALHYAVATIYENRDFAAAGGLAAYGGDFVDAYRQLGVYTGRILGGNKTTDLPVQQSTKIELIINLKTAKALGLSIPETLLATADEVIQ
jgi:putative tryptophan/tyrosine transport system substrate-binding protein